MRGQRNPANNSGDGEVDERFWAQAAAEQAGLQSNGDMDGGKRSVK
jgi:condensin complex subunit 2